jgi:hypothetical protein
MSRVWDVAGFVAGESAWPGALSGLSHAALAVADLVIMVGFLRGYRRWEGGMVIREAARHVAAVLFVSVLVHAGDALSTFRPARRAFTAVSVLAAVSAPSVVSGRPWFGFARGRAGVGAGLSGDEADDPALASGLAARERYERLKARVAALEDTSQRNAWLRERRAAMRWLGEVLAGCEPAPGELGAVGPSGAFPAGGPGACLNGGDWGSTAEGDGGAP